MATAAVLFGTIGLINPSLQAPAVPTRGRIETGEQAPAATMDERAGGAEAGDD